MEVLDQAGRQVPTADSRIGFKITGQGEPIGVGNGDPNCQETDKASSRSLFNGLAQILVQANKTPGTIVIEAYTEEWPGPKLPSTSLTITTKTFEMRVAV